MKTTLSKTEVQKKIDELFKRNSFSPEEVKKIKRLAMHYKIKLKDYRKSFCKSCLHKLEGKIRMSKTHKIVECKYCNYRNKFKLS